MNFADVCIVGRVSRAAARRGFTGRTAGATRPASEPGGPPGRRDFAIG